MNTTVWNTNVSIDFKPQNNAKNRGKPNYTPTPRPPKLTSEAFFRHKKVAPPTQIADLHKLVKKDEIPVRVISLLWLEQVWQCLVIEYKNDIIVIDAGMEFAANEELWADYIIPDISYLKKNKSKIRWIIVTHGHLDHVWAFRDILPDLDYPTIYTTPLSIW